MKRYAVAFTHICPYKRLVVTKTMYVLGNDNTHARRAAERLIENKFGLQKNNYRILSVIQDRGAV